MDNQISGYAAVFKALGDEARLKILLMLAREKTCACKILEEFCFTQPTLSYHMKQLTDSGLVDAQKEGKWVHYSINNNQIEKIKEIIGEIKHHETRV